MICELNVETPKDRQRALGKTEGPGEQRGPGEQGPKP